MRDPKAQDPKNRDCTQMHRGRAWGKALAAMVRAGARGRRR